MWAKWSKPFINHKNFKWLKFDLEQKPLIKKNLKFDYFIHIGGRSLRKENSIEDYVNGNILLAINLGRMSNYYKPKCIIYTSTREVYGEISNKILKEDNKIINPIFYGQSKYLAEKILEDFNDTISLRMPAILGKGTHGWISKIYYSLKNNHTIHFSNSRFNNFIHVNDLSKIILSFIKKIKIKLINLMFHAQT